MLESAMQNELILELCCILLIDDLHYIFAFSLNSILTMCFQKVFFRAVVDAIVTVAAAFFIAVLLFHLYVLWFIYSVFFLHSCFYVTRTNLETILYTHIQ